MRSPEARPLRTTAELWQVHPKGTRSGREAGVLNRSAGPVRTETAAWDAGRPAPTNYRAGDLASRSPLFDISIAHQPCSKVDAGRWRVRLLSSPAGAAEGNGTQQNHEVA